MHKRFLPLSWKDGLSLVLLGISSSLAGAAGVGGGPIFIPILTWVTEFSIDSAVPLSKVNATG